MDGEIIFILMFSLFFLVGFLLGIVFLKIRKGGWLRLSQNRTYVFTVDEANNGHFWEVEKILPGNLVEYKHGKGFIQLDPKAAIWLPDMKSKVFLHYAPFFRTIPAKHGAFFSFFKSKKSEVISAVKDEKEDSFERQEENQTDSIIFNLRDVLHWVQSISPAQILEGVLAAAMQFSGLKEILLKREGKFPWTIVLIVIVIAIVMLFLLPTLRIH
jgi:hypothetical protein